MTLGMQTGCLIPEPDAHDRYHGEATPHSGPIFKVLVALRTDDGPREAAVLRHSRVSRMHKMWRRCRRPAMSAPEE